MSPARKTPLGIACIAQIVSTGVLAQTSTADAVSGHVALGVRSVRVSGADSKFREDLNLEDGARLFDVAFRYAPDNATDAAFDVLDLSASNLGGDPFETIHLGVRKYGVYRLELDRRKSDYFYDDVILPAALASVSASNSGDHHRFDFERIRDTADLDIELSPRTKINLGLEHTTRSGESTSTFDIARDEFELDRPLDESLDALTIGFEHAWDNLTVVFDEQLREFDNASEWILPGASLGENTTDSSELSFFLFDQRYDFQSRGHTLRLIASPTARSGIRAALHRQALDLDLDASERSAGVDYTGAPFSTDLSGQGDVGRDIDIVTLDGHYRLSDRVTLTGSAHGRTLDQSGASLLGTDAGAGMWDMESTGIELGASVALGTRVIASFGASHESRDVTHSHADESTETERTDRDGYYARIERSGAGGLDLRVSVEDNAIDDPFTLGSPTDSQRVKVSLGRSWDSGIGLTASHRISRLENTNSAWTADTEETALRVHYERERLSLSGGISRLDLTRDVDQLVTAGTRQELFAIHYDADATLIDTRARWQLSDRVAVGGSLAGYTNDGDYPLDRDDLRAFVELDIRAPYQLRIGYRDIDYAEDRFDDYDAQLLEIALGLSF
jgi:hypothetical protein